MDCHRNLFPDHCGLRLACCLFALVLPECLRVWPIWLFGHWRRESCLVISSRSLGVVSSNLVKYITLSSADWRGPGCGNIPNREKTPPTATTGQAMAIPPPVSQAGEIVTGVARGVHPLREMQCPLVQIKTGRYSRHY